MLLIQLRLDGRDEYLPPQTRDRKQTTIEYRWPKLLSISKRALQRRSPFGWPAALSVHTAPSNFSAGIFYFRWSSRPCGYGL